MGAAGLVRWPALVLLLSQILGISVIFPVIWLPSFALAGSDSKTTAGLALTAGRVRASLALCLAMSPLTVLLFTLDPIEHSSAWAHVAGALGGPAPAVVALLLWGCPAPTHSGAKAAAVAQGELVLAHSVVAGASFLGWVINLSIAACAFGFSPSAILAALWGPSGAVRFMTIDFVVLFLGTVGAVLVDRGASAALQVVLLAPVLGPGASLARQLYKPARTF